MTKDNKDNRLIELERKHRSLDTEIDGMFLCPAVDDLEITAKKREKLAVRDEIERYKRSKQAPDVPRSAAG